MEHVSVLLDLEGKVAVVDAHVFAVVVVEEGLEGVLEVGVGALDQGCLLGVEVLV